MANALVKEGREMLALIPPRGSVAAALQAALPGSMVAAAFHHLPAVGNGGSRIGVGSRRAGVLGPPGGHGDDGVLVGRMRGLRPLDAGRLSQAAAIEAFTAVCITINMRHKTHSTLRIAGI